MITAANITEAQIRELCADPSLSPADKWECDIVLQQHKMKRANKTKARIASARARCADLINARAAEQQADGAAEPFCACGRRWSQCDGSRLGCRK